MTEVNLLQRYPKSKRKLDKPRSLDPENIRTARKFGEAFFDGRREEGYGGYRYDGRWLPIAEDIVEHFDLRPGQRVLDVGCAKGFLVKDLMTVCPGLEVFGLDISHYGLDCAEADAKGRLVEGTADVLPFADGAFDLVLSINTIHNLERPRLITALREFERLSPGRSYIQLDAYRTDAEREIFQSWVLTAMTFLKPDEWCELFNEAGYTGDYYWTILEADPSLNDFGDSGLATENARKQ